MIPFNSEQFLQELRDRFDPWQVHTATALIPPAQFKSRRDEIISSLEQAVQS